MITDVTGILVGHWTGESTGVTVILCPEGTVGSAEVRGGAPATREVALLDPTRTVETVDAVVFAGGSAFGLAAADGVVAWLAEHGRGVPTVGGPVPIVPAACIYDLRPLPEVQPAWFRPGPGAEEGRAAAEAASRGDATPERGRLGAGAGASVGKWRGADYSVPGGLGSASARVELGAVEATVGALAVVNAVGDVVDDAGNVLAGSSAPADAENFPEHRILLSDEGPHQEQEPNTTLVVVATDAQLSKVDCHLLAQSAHHGLALAVRPSHTRFDGDLAVALGTGVLSLADAPATAIDRLRHAATSVVAEAIRDAVRQT